MELSHELESGKRVPEHENQYGNISRWSQLEYAAPKLSSKQKLSDGPSTTSVNWGIQCLTSPGQALRVGELLEKQKDIYATLVVEPSISL